MKVEINYKEMPARCKDEYKICRFWDGANTHSGAGFFVSCVLSGFRGEGPRDRKSEMYDKMREKCPMRNQ